MQVILMRQKGSIVYKQNNIFINDYYQQGYGNGLELYNYQGSLYFQISSFNF